MDSENKKFITKKIYGNFPDSFIFKADELSASYLTIEFYNVNFSNSFKIPKNVKALNFSKCTFKKLPKIPNRVRILAFCDIPSLTKLPRLPNELIYLQCVRTSIKFLPKLPDKLENFDCIENKLTCLPKLPDVLKEFEVRCNYISKIIYIGVASSNLSKSFIKFYLNINLNPIMNFYDSYYDNTNYINLRVKKLRSIRSLIARF